MSAAELDAVREANYTLRTDNARLRRELTQAEANSRALAARLSNVEAQRDRLKTEAEAWQAQCNALRRHEPPRHRRVAKTA